MKKRGISLIVLIITIIVVIILAAVVILTLSKNNPIESAKEARFKEDVRTFQDELALTVSKQYTTSGGHRDEKISTSNFDEIKEYIPSFSEKYRGKLVIQDDELAYSYKVTENEETYLVGLNVKKENMNYITEGLLLHLDGINNTRNGHSDTTTVWEDLSGNNNDFNLNKFDGTGASGWQEKSLKFDGVNDYLVSKDIFDFNNTDALTIQFVDLNGEIYSNEKVVLIFESSNNCNNNQKAFIIHLNEWGNKKITFSTQQNGYNIQHDSDELIAGESMMYTLTFDAKNGYNNYFSLYKNIMKRAITKESRFIKNMDNFTFNSYPMYIGARAGNSYFCKMNFASVRIYNRVLTEEEIKHNYEIDKARFGI